MSYEDLRKIRKAKAADLDKHVQYFKVHLRLQRAKERQIKSTTLLNRLLVLVDKILGDESPPPKENCIAASSSYFADNNCALVSSSSSGISSSIVSPTSSPPSAIVQRFSHDTPPPSAKRKIFDEDYNDFSTDDNVSSSSRQCKVEDSTATQYPQQVGETVVLGPNGTEVDVKSYNSIIWSSSASATRQLLGFVFTSDVLATHTLTGKPSPAFYGRERPAKMQLDPVKAADIIYCVRSKFNCSEREIRAAITTKCSDTSKKYKRRSQKQGDVN